MALMPMLTSRMTMRTSKGYTKEDLARTVHNWENLLAQEREQIAQAPGADVRHDKPRRTAGQDSSQRASAGRGSGTQPLRSGRGFVV